MLDQIFYWLFNMSIVAGTCGIIVLLLRLIKIPKRIFTFLWAIPFIRMLVPFGVSGRYGLMSLISKFATKTVNVKFIMRSDDTFYYLRGVTGTNVTLGAKEYVPFTYKTNLLEGLFKTGSVIWISVTAILFVLVLVSYIRAKKEISGVEHFEDNVYFSGKISSPAVYGIFRPKIVIPEKLRDSDLTYILLHEGAHIKRGDNFFRLAALLLVCVHWFNPLCWLFLKLLYSDMELACDEKVLSKLDKEQRKEYAETLLSFAGRGKAFASSFGGAKLRPRIENILSFKKMSVFSALAFTLLIAAAAYILLTNAA